MLRFKSSLKFLKSAISRNHQKKDFFYLNEKHQFQSEFQTKKLEYTETN